MIEAGCEYVRITAPSINEAKNLENIKKELRKRGYVTPLIADIHFTPNAAETAARIVEKVRVNPGNYVDKKKFEQIEYSDADYLEEIERIRKRFLPLVKICKEYGTAMRIGTNHGSLSDRIMSRYGDTALGMVESALEFLRICMDENYYNIVLSMKSSNPQVMVQAYRLLIVKLRDMFSAMNQPEAPLFPLHLGVTEAGEGEDGRIKSAAGIGTLLEDGIGDTIRVSLTEDPEFELPVARALVERYKNRSALAKPIPSLSEKAFLQSDYYPYDYKRRETITINNLGNHQVPRVIADFSFVDKITPASLFAVGYTYSIPLDKWHVGDQACDYLFVGDKNIDFAIPGTLSLIQNYETWLANAEKENYHPLLSLQEFANSNDHAASLLFVTVNTEDWDKLSLLANHKNKQQTVIVMDTQNEHAMPALRRLFLAFESSGIKCPVIIKREYTVGKEYYRLFASTDCGALLLDGFGDGLWLNAPDVSPADSNKIAFGILQAARTRISKTEYISCPSCGRTLFDLQETTAKIRHRTDHLKGIKIGIMGCIVNGPGEMADADYGYVGSGVGKITLYKGRDVVQKNIDADKAVDALIDLIKANNDWIAPPEY
jgi:(E)-4-hydroxy-3-methylbut-2-enyl-diphosphate synthase